MAQQNGLMYLKLGIAKAIQQRVLKMEFPQVFTIVWRLTI